MPSVESLKSSLKKKAQSAEPASSPKSKKKKSPAPKKQKVPRRRLALEGMAMVEGETTEAIKISVVNMDSAESEKVNDAGSESASTMEANDSGFQFSFAGSDLLRKRFPKSVKLTEVVVDEWLKDGRFENLPIEHPIVEVLAQKGLRQAKEMEQKIFQHPAVEKAVVQALTLGFKAQNFWTEARKKIKK